MAIINKASMVLLALFVVATISDATRFDSSLELKIYSGGGLDFCSDCSCTEESGVVKCRRFDIKAESCPVSCGEDCICNLKYPRSCFCNYEVDSCSPPACLPPPSDIGFKDLVVRHEAKP